jgi:D-alanyl-D-alanine carboxypeptidase (penicillin-binding protein 5/6)
MSTNRRLCLRALVAAVVVLALAAVEPPDASVAVVAGVGRGPGPPDVSCASCIVLADDGRVLWARSPDAHRANASTTKMMTALLVREEASLDVEVAVSATAAATGGGGLDLQGGDAYSVEELLHALLLSSSNDAAVALAEHVATTEAAFVAEMNAAAEALGALQTHFSTAHGLDADNHYSTARDLALIGSTLLEDPVLAAIVATPRTSIAGNGGTVTLENRNLLLETYRGAIGIKTGYTASAGNVLVAAARRRGRTVVTVAMGSVDATVDSRALLDYGFARLARTPLLRSGEVVGALYWAAGGSTTVVAGETVRGSHDPDEVEVVLRPRRGDGVTAGDVAGDVVVRAAGRQIAVVDAVATDTVDVRRPWMTDALAWVLRSAAGATGRL